MRVSIFGIAALAASAASAQEMPAPPMPAPVQQQFVPWSVDQQSDAALRNALGEIPLKFSLPLLNWLNQREEMAVQADRRSQFEQMSEKMKAAKSHAPAPPAPAPSPSVPK